MSDVLTGPWWRILTMTAPDPAGLPASAEDDYAAIHSAAVAAARQGRPLVIAWLSRGDGAPLELITTAAPSAALPGAGRADSGGAAFPGTAPEVTPPWAPTPAGTEPEVGAPWGMAPTNAAPGAPASPDAGPAAAAPPARRGKHAAPARPHPPRPDDRSDPPAHPQASPAPPHSSATSESLASSGRALLFPPGAQAESAEGALDDLNRLVWVPCPARPESPADQPEPGDGPGVFETALIALMRRPFGWLVVAEPTDLLDAETAGLRTELEILRRHHERRSSFAAERTERRLAERGTFGAAGLWRVRVLAGAANPDELDVLAPLLAGAAELGPHPYQLRHTNGAQSLDAALAAQHHDPADGAQTPFFVTAGTLTALAGLPRLGVPGLNLTAPASAPFTRAPAAPARPDGTLPPDAPTGRDPAVDRGSRLLAAPVATPTDPEAPIGLEDAADSESRESSEFPDGTGIPDVLECPDDLDSSVGSEAAVGPQIARVLQAPARPDTPGSHAGSRPRRLSRRRSSCPGGSGRPGRPGNDHGAG